MEDRLEKFKKENLPPPEVMAAFVKSMHEAMNASLKLTQKIEFSMKDDKLVIRIWRPVK